jgi:quinol monooxygenase YgiN
MAALKAKPELLRKKAEFFVADVDSSFTRDNITEVSDPFIAYAIVEYKDNTIDEALKGWRRVTEESEENETDTFAYAIGRCKDKENVVRTLEVYASEKYFREVHCRGNAVAENRAKYGPEIRVAFKAHLLRLVGGWFRGNSSA